MSTYQFGIIGKPLMHSFSPDYFNNKFREIGLNARYDRFELNAIEEFNNLLASHLPLLGLNVTVPYKQSVVPYLDELCGAALELQTVNTILIHHNKRIGYNTDVIGFEKLLLKHHAQHMKGALVLGSGGSSRAVQYVLKNMDISHLVVSRKSNYTDIISYEDINDQILVKYPLIIHCTPVGMYPDVEQTIPFPFELLSAEQVCIDLIYNPRKTLFLQKAELKYCRIINGYDMLIEQAEAAWQIWKRYLI